MSRAGSHLRLLVPALAALVVLALAATAQADYEQVGLFGQGGSGEQLRFSTAAAVNTTGAGGVEAGSVYTTGTRAVSRYNAKGEIKEVWGWGTIASGPDLPNQVNTLKVNATSGTYELKATTAEGLGIYTKGSKVATSVFAEVGSFHVGDLLNNERQVTGNITVGSNIVTGVSTVEEGFIGRAIHGSGIPPNTTITGQSLEAKTLTLSQAASETRSGVSLRTESVITAVGNGTIEFSAASGQTSFSGRDRITGRETTAPIPYNASATELKEAFVALPAFGPGDVSVTGTSGNYELTFEGSYAGSPVELASTESTLAGGVPSSSVAIATLVRAETSGFQRCHPDNGDVCVSPENSPTGGTHAEEEFSALSGVAVDQSTGYVYVLNEILTSNGGREHNLIEIFSADGSEVITRFGDGGTETETFDEGPAKLHPTPGGGIRRIAVDESGKVYLTDISLGNREQRVMCFQPESPGDYKHYEYCGRPQDINLKVGSFYLSQLALDDSGHLYVGDLQAYQELSLAEPTAPPLCTYNTNGQGIGMTVNPLTGEVFFFNSNNQRIYRLKPCDPAKGTFEEAQARIKGSPLPAQVMALAFNPTLSWGPQPPPGRPLRSRRRTAHRRDPALQRPRLHPRPRRSALAGGCLGVGLKHPHYLGGPARRNQPQRLWHPLRLPV
jgi:hypothetical protein